MEEGAQSSLFHQNTGTESRAPSLKKELAQKVERNKPTTGSKFLEERQEEG